MGDHRRFLKPQDITWMMCGVEEKRVKARDSEETIRAISLAMREVWARARARK